MNKIEKIALLAMSFLTGCCVESPVDENRFGQLEVVCYEKGNKSLEVKISELPDDVVGKMRTIATSFRSQYSVSYVTYVPNIVAYGNDVSINFLGDMVVVNVDGRQYCRAYKSGEDKLYADIKTYFMQIGTGGCSQL